MKSPQHIKKKIDRLNIINKIAVCFLKKNESLWNVLGDYRKKSNSTGASYSDYLYLYRYIRRMKPKHVLECGTGVTTIVMAYAMRENGFGMTTSMESKEEWYRHAIEIFPSELMKGFAEIFYSPAIEYTHSMFRGMGYAQIPDRPYEMIFIDGPAPLAGDGTKAFNIDYLNIVRRSKNKLFGIADNRMPTCFVMRAIFGKDKVRFSRTLDLGFIGPCGPEDIRYRKCEFDISGMLNRLR